MSFPLSAKHGVYFQLDPDFVANYATLKPPFGFGGLGELVYLRTYSRTKEDGQKERWHETIERVVNGTYSMQKRWILAQKLPWSESKAQRSAQDMYDRMWHMKFLPPGRGLWAMGSPLTEERDLHAALFNCAFISTKNIATAGADIYAWLMNASMCGIGCGFDTAGANLITIQHPKDAIDFVIPDSREGWVESVRLLLNAYFLGSPLPRFDYNKIRPAGLPLKGFGGVSGGPECLMELHRQLQSLLQPLVQTKITETTLVDLANLIGKCVVAGNLRRTALLALGSATDE